MTISTETRRAGPYTGNGSTVNFPFAFKVFATNQVLVTRTVSGVETVLVLTTDYTVALNSNQNSNPGGTVTMLVAPPVGHSITITSNVANLQPTAVVNAGGFYPEVINDSLDRATIQIQQLDERLDRALVIPVSSSGIDTELPVPASGALIGWDNAGTALQNYNSVPIGGTIYQYLHRTIATAGQTAFVLPVPYTLGANALSVFVNGLRVEAGSGLDYVETNTTTITFTSGLANGDLVVVGIQTDVDAAATPPNYTIDSIAALRLLNSSTTANHLILLRNYVMGDGGGIFRYDSTDNSSADNGGTIIVDAANRRWKRQIVKSEYISAENGGTVQDAVDELTALPHAQRARQKLLNNNQDVNVVLLGDSTGDALTEWYYLLASKLAVDFPTHTFKYADWDNTGGSYNSESTLATGTGARTIKFWNASVSGSVASHHASDRFNAAVAQPAPDLIFLSYGHNGGTADYRQLDFFNGIAATLNSQLPDVPVVVIGQNPTLSDETMAAKILVLRGFAARNGYGFIDVHAAFKQAGVALSTLMADAVHPNAAGQAIWRDVVYLTLFSTRQNYGGAAFAPGTLVASYSTIAEFSKWTTSNCTVTKNTTDWETTGHSTQLACTASGVSYIYTQLASGDNIIALRGKYVTVHARLRVPAGNLATSGRIDLIDSAGTTSAVGVTQGDDFISFTCTRKIDAAATTLSVYVYPLAESGTNTIQIDRLSCVVGVAPVDVVRPINLEMQRFSLFASGASGLGWLHNTNTTAAGLRFVPSETAAPATEWTSDFCQDGFNVKQTGDTHSRIAIQQSGIFFGPGNAAGTMRIAYRLSDGVGINANWYPNSNATYDLGANGIAWRNVVATAGYFINSIKVVGARQTGWAAATGTATRTTFATTTVTTEELAERVKALIDDLITHGLIGA